MSGDPAESVTDANVDVETDAASDAAAQAAGDAATDADGEASSTESAAEESGATGGGPTVADRVAEYDDNLAAEVAALEARVDGLEAERDKAEATAEELRSRLKRTQADFQNYKKRAKKRQSQIKDRAAEDFVECVVTVCDNLVRALDQDEDADIRGGLESTLRESDRILGDENVEITDPEPGTDVDPNRHGVMMRIDSDQPAGTVAGVFQPGYEMADKVIRATQITVSKGEQHAADRALAVTGSGPASPTWRGFLFSPRYHYAVRLRSRRRRSTVRVTQHGDLGDDNLLFVLGWGNEPGHRSVEWLLDRLTYEGYRVHAAKLPTNGWEFERQYVSPVRAYAVDRDTGLVLNHSTGGLVAAYFGLTVRNVFLSPQQGTAISGLAALLFPPISRLPTTKPIVPSSISRVDLGELKLAAELTDAPTNASPAFLRMIRGAQASLSPFRPDNVVFVSLSDRVMGIRAIGDRTPASNLVPYDGGHEFFASKSRERTLSTVLDALDGVDASSFRANGADATNSADETERSRPTD